MSKSTLPEGYSYIPGTNNTRVLTPEGQDISRRQARNIGAQERGFPTIDRERTAKLSAAAADLGLTRKEYQAIRSSDSYRWALKHWKEQHPDYKRNPIGGSFDKRWAAFVNDRSAVDKKGRPIPDNTPTGPRARFLVDAGLRPPDAGWAVGDTDKQSRGAI